VTAQQLRESHLLLLPAHIPPEDVEALVLTRYPEMEKAEDGAMRFGRHTGFAAPLILADPESVDSTAERPLVYALECPVEREDPPMPGTSRPDGLHRAFPDGMPTRAEARAVELMLAIARRLDGAVRIAGSGVVLQPDPHSRIDLTVYSPYWLEPEMVLWAVKSQEPTARLALEGEQWEGPPDGLVDRPADEASANLREELRVGVHAAADRYDAAAMDAPDVLDAFAVVVHLGPDGRHGLLEVRVHPVEETVPALAGQDWADQTIAYEVHWSPPDERQAALEHPSTDYLMSRDIAATSVGLVASALVDVAEGVLVDADGFLVDRYDL
jgi:hypothetical protein